jgi:hypothetical protein
MNIFISLNYTNSLMRKKTEAIKNTIKINIDTHQKTIYEINLLFFLRVMFTNITCKNAIYTIRPDINV